MFRKNQSEKNSLIVFRQQCRQYGNNKNIFIINAINVISKGNQNILFQGVALYDSSGVFIDDDIAIANISFN